MQDSYMKSRIKILRRFVEYKYLANASLAQSVPVKESVDGKTWNGIVYIFHIVDNGKEKLAYAWYARDKVGEKQQIFVLLHRGAIKSPRDAVRAAMLTHKYTEVSDESDEQQK